MSLLLCCVFVVCWFVGIVIARLVVCLVVKTVFACCFGGVVIGCLFGCELWDWCLICCVDALLRFSLF